MFNTQILAGSSGQGGGEVQQSLKFDRASIAYLSRTASSPTLGTKATWSFWIKKSDVSEDTSSSYRTVFYAGTPNSDGFRVGFARYSGNGHSLQISQDQGSSAAYMFKRTDAALRDTSAWYNFVISYDSTNATAADRIKVYINGELASFKTSPNVNPPLNHIPAFQVNGKTLKIGDGFGGAYNEAIDGYLSNIHFIDGQALTPTSFGQFTNGYWEKIDYAGTYGNNGFHLTFQDDVVSEGFNTVTYRGTGAEQSISGLGFSPNFVWLKSRTSGGQGHRLIDTVRGAPLSLKSHATDAEFNDTTGLTSFNADGFTLGTLTDVNASGNSYVGWCWDAGSGSPVSNTDGTITSTVKANPAYGFSIVSYTGSSNTSFGHGLSSQPEMVLIKRRDSAAQWAVYHTGLSSTSHYLNLDDTGAEASYGSAFINPGSTTITIDANSSLLNANGGTYIAYCFAEVAGYSSIGSYTGNGSTSGPTVTTGFLPAFLLIKRTDVADNWHIADNTRSTDGTFNDVLRANLANAESENTGFNITYNNTGFTLASTNSELNASGGTYIYMAFADTREAAFWKDVSGQGNHWTPNNLDYRDSLPDSPVNNFATLNPLYSSISASYPTPALSEGNLAASTSSGSNWKTVPSTMYMSTGKWYAEVKVTYTDSVDCFIGFASSEFNGQNYAPSETAFGYQFHPSLGIRHNSAQLSAQTFTQGDIIGLALNMDDNEIKFYKNGSLLYTATSVAAGSWSVALTLLYTKTLYANFGQDSTFAGRSPMGAYTDDSKLGTFQYQPPAGFKSLCSQNLPIPTIIDGSEYFNTVTYTGTGATTLSITGVGFQPDWVWAKKRSASDNHAVADTVRGVTKTLFPNTTGAESTDVNGLKSFDSDGFTIGSGSGSGVWGGNSGATYAAWNWKAGGAAVSNTDGSITSQVSANTTAGFSIVSYVANGTNTATVGHGLSVEPKMVIQKNRSAASDWLVYTDLVDGSDDYLLLNSTAAKGNAAGGATATVFNSWDRTSGNNMIAYCFADVEGYSKVGKFSGNGNADGTFVFLGFRPSFVLFKRTDAVDNWVLEDSARNTSNINTKYLLADTSGAEGTVDLRDFLSNGFKMRGSAQNASGGTYIYLAFAETPFKYANAR